MPHDIDKRPKKIMGEYRMISNLIQRRILSEVSDDDALTVTYSWILGYLERHEEEDIYQRDLEERFCLRRATISKTLLSMEQKGLVRRVSAPTDARMKILRLTDKGKKMNREMIARFERIEQEITRDIPPQMIENFFELSELIRQRLQETEEKEI